jgi:ketosteroid isomerase-like protein
MTDAEIQMIRDAVTARLNDYVEASLSLDAEKCLDCFASTEEPVSAMDGKLVVGWDAHVEYFREGLKTLVTGDYFRFKSIHVYPLAADAAVCTADFEWSFSLESGEHLRSEGAWTYAFKRIGDTWRIVQSGGAHVFLPSSAPSTVG